MNVLDTVTKLIMNWPSLYSNRASALKSIFTSNRWQWIDGELCTNDESEVTRDTQLFPLHVKVEGDLDQRLNSSKQNAIMSWTIANADLIAQNTMATPEHDCLWLPASYNRFDDMPEDVKDDWKEAAREIATHLFYSTSDANKGTHEYDAHRALMPFMISQKFIDTQVELIAELEAEIAEREDQVRLLKKND